MDEVFKALADPVRRRLLDRLNTRSGQSLRDLCAGLDMARQSVSKHLAVLEDANLVTTVRVGRQKLHYLNAAPINDISARWIHRYDVHRVHALADLKSALEDRPGPEHPTVLEDRPMQAPDFVYTTYIRTTPERLWQALTEPAFTRRYWEGVELDSDWVTGSTYRLTHKGVTITDPEQVVVESEPFRRLSYRWHTFATEWAEANGIDAERLAAIAAERRSTVTFEIEPLEGMVKLTVVHGDFEPDSIVATMVSGGWPKVISDLKTLLETGETLPFEA